MIQVTISRTFLPFPTVTSIQNREHSLRPQHVILQAVVRGLCHLHRLIRAHKPSMESCGRPFTFAYYNIAEFLPSLLMSQGRTRGPWSCIVSINFYECYLGYQHWKTTVFHSGSHDYLILPIQGRPGRYSTLKPPLPMHLLPKAKEDYLYCYHKADNGMF